MMVEEVKPITHAELVKNLKKSGQEIAQDFKDSVENKTLLLVWAHYTKNISQELDVVKKQAIYNKDMGSEIDLDLFREFSKADVSADQADMLHMAVGILGEAGEVMEAVLSNILDEEPLDMENIVEELGDIEFFTEGLRQNLSITREETLSQNIRKLGVRYNSGTYSDNQAQIRADKA
jgi:NTP pyrophosphatase (non-canonical NTP hydrolase)